MASKKNLTITMTISAAKADGDRVLITGTDNKTVSLSREDATAVGTTIGTSIALVIASGDKEKFESGEPVSATKASDPASKEKVNRKEGSR